METGMQVDGNAGGLAVSAEGRMGIRNPAQSWGLHIWLNGGIIYGGRKTGHRAGRCFGEKQAFCFAHVPVSGVFSCCGNKLS